MYRRVEEIVFLLKASKVRAYRLHRDTDCKVTEIVLTLKACQAQMKHINFTTILILLMITRLLCHIV